VSPGFLPPSVEDSDVLRFIKTTVLGGILFLVPIVIFIVVIGKALQLINMVAEPMAKLLPFATFGGMGIAQLIALGLLTLTCFIAGLAARSVTARGLVQSLETNVLDRIPAYALLKARAGSVLTPEDTRDMQPVLIKFDDSWQVGFEVEKTGDGNSLVFLPGAPDPWSGSVCVVDAERIQPLPLNIREVSDLMKRLGKGSSEALRATLSAQARAAT
jgi:uncharacterized membrane protein